MRKVGNILGIMLTALLLASCSFRLQGQMVLAPALKRLYIRSANPYGTLVKNLQASLRLSGVELTSTPEDATMILAINSDETSQELLSVSGTQQTRQYNLHVTVSFSLDTPKGKTVMGPEILTETRALTVQSNAILGNSNEAQQYYQQMRRILAYEIMNRISSKQITRVVNQATQPAIGKKSR